MKWFSKSTATLAIAGILLITAMVCGCTDTGGDVTPTTGPVETLTITGSTTVLPLAQLTAEAYMDAHANADIQVSGGGSSVGVKAVGVGTHDIGMASRGLKDAEKTAYPGLVQHVVAKDGIAIIVYQDNPVTTLSLEQVKAIYKGDIRNWKDVGGDDMAIVVIGRDSASGTREYFYEEVMDEEDFYAGQLEKNSNGAVKQTVRQTPGAIGYVGLGYLDETVGAVALDVGGVAVEPSVGNVLAGTYPVARDLNMFTNGEPEGLAADYLAFVMSDEGQQIAADEGFVPVA
ncbi:phosphate-binding protein [Methanomicrobiaceae archaeon CYW5]|uniref:phosphate ABC transporter substrate-binding protein n=1 Tax=Methanovulcanius yangii TaxID=1789227 RepID=UPI0029CA2B2A|nr:phosphate ABC transporter substrate-binding protein [Methanovulcanius yangii]MBT8508614.1 phosphate-binding protein [Methanovulcanius yangii]